MNVEICLSVAENSIKASWNAAPRSGSFEFRRSMGFFNVELAAERTTWSEFKAKYGAHQHGSLIFRGQQRAYKLRTSLHRSGRANLRRFLNEDVRILHRRLSGQLQHQFNLADSDQNGAFLNLIQHHGYPTPLLDWTYSPFVAAFFAYRNVTEKRISEKASGDAVRIFVIDRTLCRRVLPAIYNLSEMCLHFSLMDFPTLENPRLVPQQSISGVTNLDDIEGYLVAYGFSRGERLLWAYDLPVHSRSEVMNDLQMMGISAGSLFPGIDGVCEEMRETRFSAASAS